MKGYFKNEAVVIPGKGSLNPTGSEKRFPNASNFIVRGTALIEPSSNYTARLKVSYTKTDEDGSATALDVGYCPDGTGGVAPTNIPFIGGDNCKLDNVFHVPIPDPNAFPGARNGAKPFFKSTQVFGTLEQNLNLGEALKLTSITGYYHNDLSTIHLASSTGTVAVIIQDNDFYNNQFTQEVRLESDFKDSPINFMIGGFYLKGKRRATMSISTRSRHSAKAPGTSPRNSNSRPVRAGRMKSAITPSITSRCRAIRSPRWSIRTSSRATSRPNSRSPIARART
jgi:iron complex outermembrane receptor protein